MKRETRMRILHLSALALCLAAGVSQAESDRFYGALMGHYVFSDDARPDLDDAGGWSAALGWTLPTDWERARIDIEFSGFGSYIDHESDAVNDYFHGVGLDLRWRPFAGAGVDPYLIGGGGAVYEDTQFLDKTFPMVNLGLGMRVATPFRNISLRGETRAYGVFNDRIGVFATPPRADEDFYIDTRISLGVEVAFSTAVAVGDADDDGVIDGRDQCEGTPLGREIDGRGCPLPADSDGDGVTDDRDACPGTPVGVAVLSTGCPPEPVAAMVTPAPAAPLDADGDGVANTADRCPDTPRGMRVDAAGCVVQQVVVFPDVNFEFGSDRLTPGARNTLLNMAGGLRGQPTLKLEIAGHTDALGTQVFNLKLSQKRAEAVRAYLMANGIAGDRLMANGYGEGNPVASNASEAGRAENRRVEFRVTSR